MKLKLVIKAVIDVPDDAVQRIYGTADPAECARIEQNNPLGDLLAIADEVTHRIEPVFGPLHSSKENADA